MKSTNSNWWLVVGTQPCKVHRSTGTNASPPPTNAIKQAINAVKSLTVHTVLFSLPRVFNVQQFVRVANRNLSKMKSVNPAALQALHLLHSRAGISSLVFSSFSKKRLSGTSAADILAGSLQSSNYSSHLETTQGGKIGTNALQCWNCKQGFLQWQRTGRRSLSLLYPSQRERGQSA